jgi:hypothetical protein
MQWQGQVITPPFQVTGGILTILPTSEASFAYWPLLLLVFGALVALGGLRFTFVRAEKQLPYVPSSLEQNISRELVIDGDGASLFACDAHWLELCTAHQ